MAAKFGFYPWIYANKKAQLVPLIEKYSGQNTVNMTHGDLIPIYQQLLISNPDFVVEVDKLAPAQFRNALDPVTAIAEGIGAIFKVGSSAINQSAAMDSEFAQATLAAQKAKNTQTILIVGGITLVSLSLIGLGIYLAVKKRRA